MNELLDKLPGTAQRVYAELGRYENLTRHGKAQVAAARLGMCRRSLLNALHALRAAGLISYTEGRPMYAHQTALFARPIVRKSAQKRPSTRKPRVV